MTPAPAGGAVAVGGGCSALAGCFASRSNFMRFDGDGGAEAEEAEAEVEEEDEAGAGAAGIAGVEGCAERSSASKCASRA